MATSGEESGVSRGSGAAVDGRFCLVRDGIEAGLNGHWVFQEEVEAAGKGGVGEGEVELHSVALKLGLRHASRLLQPLGPRRSPAGGGGGGEGASA